jgi:molybdate transport system substrate-binding protein
MASRSIRRALGLALVVVVAVGATACGGGGDSKASTPTTSGANAFVLWAPSDIQASVDRILRAYKKRFPDVEVTTVYEAQADLNDRLLVGERPDLYIGTGAQVNSLGDDGTLPKDTRLLGTDALVIAVAPGNPKKIADYTVFELDPLTRSGLCKPDVGCGRAARTVLSDLRIIPAPDVTAPDAKTLVNQVAAGDLDAAVVYRSDAVRAVRAHQIGIVRVSGGDHGVTEYKMVIVHPGAAVDSFLKYVKRSKTVSEILQNAGLAPLVPPQPGQGKAPAAPSDTEAPQQDQQPN